MSRSALLLVMLITAACGSDRERTSERDPALAPRTDATVDIDSQHLSLPAAALEERASTRQETLMIDGVAEVVSMRLIRAPRPFPVPFSTYVPEGIAADFQIESSINQVRFTDALAEDAAGQPFMAVQIYAAGTTRLLVEDDVRQAVVSRAPGFDAATATDPPSWAEWAARLSFPHSAGEVLVGHAYIAQYGPRFFHVIQLYPASIADGIQPRFEAILENWRWDDTGRMLTR